jgi:hypothetical protein
LFPSSLRTVAKACPAHLPNASQLGHYGKENTFHEALSV